MSNTFLFMAFMIIWIGLALYLTLLIKKLTSVEREIQLLKEYMVKPKEK